MSRRKTIVVLTVVVLWASAIGLAAGRPSKLRPVGYVATQGEVRVGRHPAPSGTAVFAGDVITTGTGSIAGVNFFSGAAATLSENGEFSIRTDASAPYVRLARGTMALRNAGRESAEVGVPGATVVVRGQAGFPAICRIAFAGRAASVWADRGHVEVRTRGASRLVLPGKSYRFEAGMPQAAGQTAGKVTNAIPQETVQHPGQTAHVPLNMNDNVVWEDTVRTLGTGRVRISLSDGSVLNVGARSTMKIVRHDAQSEQTEIEMQLGKLRGQVVKITKPGGSFQVRTNTAVIGVVGTIFLIDIVRNITRVMCLEGALNVRNINPNVPGERTLRSGEQTSVQAGQAPGAVTPTSPTQITEELNVTNAGEVPSPELTKFGEFRHPGGVAPSAPGPSAPPVAPGLQVGTTAIHAASAGASGLSAVLAGVAIKKASDATDEAENARATAGEAADAADSATGAATDAANAATGLSNGVQTVIDELSPGGGGCGCLP
jgi:ferric-dicitrate binding protein FerR (iron transport regulator)